MKKRKHILLALEWYHAKLQYGVQLYAREHKWHLNTGMVQSPKSIPYGWQGDGIICSSLTGKGELYDFVTKATCPKVAIGAKYLETDVPHIHTNAEAIARLAVEHFVERGFKNYAGYSRSQYGGINPRLVSFSQQLNEKNRSCKIITPPSAMNSWAARREWLQSALKQLSFPTAIFAVDDDSGIELIEACVDAGIAVPEQVAVLGVENDEMKCELLDVPLSSIDSNLVFEGYAAAHLLDRLINGETNIEQGPIIFPRGLSTRKSTDLIAVSDPAVAKALKLIKESYRYPLNVDRIADDCSVSRRTLFYAFKKEIGRSPAQEIMRLRIFHAKKMLEETDEKLKNIALESGFGSPYNFFTNFKKATGITPKSYRLKHRETLSRSGSSESGSPFS